MANNTRWVCLRATDKGEQEALKGDVQVQWESVEERQGNKGGEEVLKGEEEDLKHVMRDRCIRRQRGGIGRGEREVLKSDGNRESLKSEENALNLDGMCLKDNREVL